jgi:RNA recognition motif-containing protein
MTNIFVGNLSFQTSQADLQYVFNQYGEVSRASVVMDRETGKSRGFGFVEMADANAARQAIEALNGAELHGRAMNVNEARPKTSNGGGYGGNRGNGGGHRSGGRGQRW